MGSLGGLVMGSRLVFTSTSLTRSAFVRTHLASFPKRRELACYSQGEIEELDERPRELFLTAARKSLGSC